MRAPDFWQEDGLAARLLNPMSRLYGLAGALRGRLVTPKRVGIPVICVGNLTAGGAGKTPTAMAIAERLKARGAHPHFLTRGYGGVERGPLLVDPAHHAADAVGDEPLLLQRLAPTWVSVDRVAGAKAAASAGASHLVMDDGLQNPHLEKDLLLLVIDGATGFGNRRLLPAGPLREPINRAISRIDAVIVIGNDRTDIEAMLPTELQRLSAEIQPIGDAEKLRNRRLLAFAGIGRPQKFFETLEGLGAKVIETRAFSDHHRYTTIEVEALLARARQIDAACVTTEKDHIRLPEVLGKSVEKLQVCLRFHEPERLDQLLLPYSMGHAAPAK